MLASTGVTLLHPQRFAARPESIAELLHSDRHWHLVRGEVLALAPPGAAALRLPFDLPVERTLHRTSAETAAGTIGGRGADGGGRTVGHDAAPAVLARVDVEETDAWTRPRLTTVERARDFYVADAHGRALVRVADDGGRLHPDIELHLGGPFVEHPLEAAPNRVMALVRTICAGDPIYLLGRSRLVTHGELVGLRDAPLIPCFAGDLGPLHLYDEPAFRQLAAWYALPWYRKLSVLVRNR